MITKQQLIKSLKEEGEWWGIDNVSLPFFGNSYNPKVIIVLEKLSLLNKLKEEIIKSSNKKEFEHDFLLMCSHGFPSPVKLSALKMLVKPITKLYYFGDLDPVSITVYSFLRKAQTKIKWLGLKVNDTKGLPNKWLIKLSLHEQRILSYLTEHKITPELKNELNYLNKGFKLEAEAFYLSLKARKVNLLNYFNSKGLLKNL